MITIDSLVNRHHCRQEKSHRMESVAFFLVGPLKRYRLLTHFSCASLASSETDRCLVLLIHVDLFFPNRDCASIILIFAPTDASAYA